MISASFGLSETGSIRAENQDNFLLDGEKGYFAVADGLGGLPNGERASRMALNILRKKLLAGEERPLHEIIAEVNEETRQVGYNLDSAGFGTTLTMARLLQEKGVLELAHVGDSAAFLVHDNSVHLLTHEHTVAARMVAEQWEDASEAIPLTAHHTLTQCIGQDLYIDPQIARIPVARGDRFFLFTDGVTKSLSQEVLEREIAQPLPLAKICQTLTFRIEVAGSPDNYTVVAVEF